MTTILIFPSDPHPSFVSNRSLELKPSLDEVNVRVIVKYIISKKGLEDTVLSVSSFRYIWEELEQTITVCRESEWWPFESDGIHETSTGSA